MSDEPYDYLFLSYLVRVPHMRTYTNHLHPTDLHTGTLDCPMSFNVQLEPSDWKRFAKQGLRLEVLGGGQNTNPLIRLVNAMETRQRRWHADESMHTEEREKIFGKFDLCKNRGENATCLRMVSQIKAMIVAMNWD